MWLAKQCTTLSLRLDSFSFSAHAACATKFNSIPRTLTAFHFHDSTLKSWQSEMWLYRIITIYCILQFSLKFHCYRKIYKRLCYCRGTARRATSVEILWPFFLTQLLTRSSANAEEPCEHTVSWNRVKCPTNVRRIACENVCNRWMTYKVIQGHCRCYHLIGHILFPISLPL